MLVSDLFLNASIFCIGIGLFCYFLLMPSKKGDELENSYHQTIKEGKQPDRWQKMAHIRKIAIKSYFYLFCLGLTFLVVGLFLEMLGV